ncbi:MAG: phosphotransferase family protein [Pseudonocardia sp.]
MAAAIDEVAVAGWLSKHDVPAARTWPIDQPLVVDGHPVTFWHHIGGRRGGPGDGRALGELLRRVHALQRPGTFDLSHEAVLERVQPRIERAPIPPADRAFLLVLLDELSAAVAELRYSLAPCVTHGDAHVQNLMVTDENVVLIDFERVAWGQPDWDLGMTATEHVTAGWGPRSTQRHAARRHRRTRTAPSPAALAAGSFGSPCPCRTPARSCVGCAGNRSKASYHWERMTRSDDRRLFAPWLRRRDSIHGIVRPLWHAARHGRGGHEPPCAVRGRDRPREVAQ